MNIVRTYIAFLSLAGLFYALILSLSSARAGDQALRALAERDLEPAAHILAMEAKFTWNPESVSALDTVGFLVRLPEPEDAKQVLIGGPRNSVIADVAIKPGPLAISNTVAVALGLQADRTEVLQLVALRKQSLVSSVPVPGGATETTADTKLKLFKDTNMSASSGSGTSKGQRLALQAGYFNSQRNAISLTEKLSAKGLPVEIREQTSKGKTGWLVVVGPFTDQRSRTDARIKGGELLSGALSRKF
ncbi:MAG: SPOR domain-containing protein [Paracoccaceae bacterium]